MRLQAGPAHVRRSASPRRARLAERSSITAVATTVIAERLSIEAGLCVGPRWLYGIVPPDIALDAPAHPSLRAVVQRYARGCLRHRSVVCDPAIRDGGQSCTWRADGRGAARWPDPAAGQGDS
jgi:hypothetical protein